MEIQHDPQEQRRAQNRIAKRRSRARKLEEQRLSLSTSQVKESSARIAHVFNVDDPDLFHGDIDDLSKSSRGATLHQDWYSSVVQVTQRQHELRASPGTLVGLSAMNLGICSVALPPHLVQLGVDCQDTRSIFPDANALTPPDDELAKGVKQHSPRSIITDVTCPKGDAPSIVEARPLELGLLGDGEKSLHVWNSEILSKGRPGTHRPIQMASANGQVESVSLLLQLGADITVRDERGRTAAHIAVINGHQDVLEVLLRHGLDPEVVDEDGETALSLAAALGLNNIIMLLVDWGARLQ